MGSDASVGSVGSTMGSMGAVKNCSVVKSSFESDGSENEVISNLLVMVTE